jgi:alanine-synthesizing transaminase
VGKVSVAKRVGRIEYAIREVAVVASQLAKSGKKIIPLNIGDPVAFDFKTPDHIKEALFKAVRENRNMYGPSEGQLELRKAISERLSKQRVNVSEDDVVVTNGISEAIQMVTGVLVDEGDEILVPSPNYPSYNSYVRYFGGVPVAYRTVEEKGWTPDIDDLRGKVTSRTKAILLINPNNPTGAVCDDKSVRAIVQIAAENRLPIISDEIYDEILFSGSHTATASVAKDTPVIGLNGFSKAHLMTGWRLGYIYFHNVDASLDGVKDGVLRASRIRLCANTPVQFAGVAALRGSQDHITDMVRRLRERRDLCLRLIRETELMSSATPEGAFYLFPKIRLQGTNFKSDKEFVFALLRETGVCVVHGSGFGEDYGSGHFRMVFLPPPEILEDAMEKIQSYLLRAQKG